MSAGRAPSHRIASAASRRQGPHAGMTDDTKATPPGGPIAASDPAATRPCPVCKTPIVAASPAAARFRPFCSRACADVDLLRWLRGSYVVAGTGVEDDEDGETNRSVPAADPSEDTRH